MTMEIEATSGNEAAMQHEASPVAATTTPSAAPVAAAATTTPADDMSDSEPMDRDGGDEPAVDDDSDDDDDDDDTEKEWSDLSSDGGVMKKVLSKGTGWEKPGKGAEVKVHYVGTLLDGTQFDSSRDRDKPFEFKIEAGSVIKGWDIAVKSMKKAEKALFRIKPEYAYGSQSVGSIPANSTLDFEIELLSWQSETDLTKDGGVLKRSIEDGKGWDQPKEGSTVTVHLVGRVNDGGAAREFVNTRATEQPVTFVIGEEQEIAGLEKCVESMKKGAQAHVRIRSDYAYGATGNERYGIGPNSDLEYEVELVDFTKAKEPWAMTSSERLENSARVKDEGNRFFAEGRVSMAVRRYKRSLELVAHANFNDEEKAQSKKLEVASNLNLAACYIKQGGKWKEVLGCCNKVLEYEHANIKALYRRSLALTELREYEQAKRDLKQLLSIDPNNADAKRANASLDVKIKQQDAKDRSLYSRMFA